MISDPTPFQTRSRLISEFGDELVQLRAGEFPGPYPVQLEVNVAAGCNQKCHWCISENAHDHLSSRLDLDSAGVAKFFEDFRAHGGRFVGWSGGGEPTTHRDFAKALRLVDEAGLPQGLLTHGAFSNRYVGPVAKYCEWVRVSLDTPDPEMYRHKRGIDGFAVVERNARALVAAGSVRVGLNMNVAEWNKEQIREMFECAKDWNASYLQVRPTLPRPFTNKVLYKDDDLDVGSIDYVIETLNAIQAQRSPSDPELIVSMDKFTDLKAHDWGRQDPDWGYQGCRAHEVFVVLDASGNLTVCMYQLGRENFILGNVYEQSLEEIWNSERRRRAVDFCRKLDHGSQNCQACCKGHEINKVLLAPAATEIHFSGALPGTRARSL